jgi:uncharacterized damage-inducible protein DinB
LTPQEAASLVEYHYWARDRLLDAVGMLTADQYLQDLGNSFKSVRDTLVHTYGAEHIWYLRWTGGSPTGLPDPAEFPDLASLCTAWTAQEVPLRQLVLSLATSDELERRIAYRLFNGQPAESSFAQMLQHVVNHASYHRGQVTTMLRQLGAPAPKSQDMIAFYRERTTKT